MAANGDIGLTENHFWSHFSPFQINTQLLFIFFTKWLPAAILDDRKSRSIASFFFTKWLPAAILDDRKSLSIAFLDISDQYATRDTRSWLISSRWELGTSAAFQIIRFVNPSGSSNPLSKKAHTFFLIFFFTKWLTAAIWMTENHFRSHFSQFQINTQLWFLLISFHKWLPAAILDDRKSPSIAFLAISDQYALLFLFTKWLPAAILDDRKSLSIEFLAISDQYATFICLHKMATGGHFGWPKITLPFTTTHASDYNNSTTTYGKGRGW